MHDPYEARNRQRAIIAVIAVATAALIGVAVGALLS
jgi:hypothetical protein